MYARRRPGFGITGGGAVGAVVGGPVGAFIGSKIGAKILPSIDLMTPAQHQAKRERDLRAAADAVRAGNRPDQALYGGTPSGYLVYQGSHSATAGGRAFAQQMVGELVSEGWIDPAGNFLRGAAPVQGTGAGGVPGSPNQVIQAGVGLTAIPLPLVGLGLFLLTQMFGKKRSRRRR